MVLLDAFVCFKVDIFISPCLLISVMYLSITWFWAIPCQGLEKLVKVNVICDRGKLGRLAKDSLWKSEHMRIDSLHTGRLTEGKPSGFMNHFGVFPINPCGHRWKGFSSPKSGRFSFHVLEVSCRSKHWFTSNHALPSPFHTQEMRLLCDVWMLEKNGDIGFESYILRLKSGVASIQERGSLGNSVKSIVKAL